MASLNTNTLTASEQAELDALNSTGLTPAEQAELDALNNVVVKKQPQPTTQQFGANSDIFKIPTFNKPVTTTEVATRTPVGTPTQKELITGNYLVNTKKKVPDFAVLGKGTPVEQTQQPIQENQNPYYVDITAKQDNLAPKNVKAQGIPYINPKMVVESMDTESLLNTDINTMKKFMDAGKDTKQIEFEKESANNNIVNKYGKEMSVYEMQIGELQKRAKQHEDVLKMKYGEDFFKAINTESDNLKYQTQQFQSYTTKRKKEYNSLIADLDEIKNQVQSGEIDQTQGEVAYNAKVAQIKAIEQDISGRQQQISQKQEEFIKKADDEDFNNYIRINGKINDLYNESGQLITKPEFKEYRDLMDAGDEAQKQRDAIESFAFPLTLTQKIQGEFNKLLGRTAEMGASALKMLKSNVPFQDESKYDIVDKIFDKAVEWSKEKQILNPVATSQQRDINQKFADVDGYKVLINDEGNPTEVRTDKFKKIDAKTEQGILDKYTKNPKAYPKQTDFSISNLVTKSVPTILDMAELISITALTGGGSAAMVGTAAAQMYSGIYQQGLEAGLKPQEASDFATMTSLMMGSVSLVNPMESNIAKGIAGKSVGRFFGNAITKADVQLIRTGEMTLMDKAKRFAIESAKNIAGENLEELVLEPFAQNVTQTVYNEKAKQNGGGFETNWNTLQGKQAAETAMITTMTSLFMTPIELSNSMPEQHKIALQRALDNPQAFLEKRNELLNNGDESREKFDYEVKAFEYISAQYNAIKSEIPEELHDDLSELLLKKYTLVNKIKEVGDDVLNKKNKALLQDVDRRLEEMVDGNYDKAKETAISAVAEGRTQPVKAEYGTVATYNGGDVKILEEYPDGLVLIDTGKEADGDNRYIEVPGVELQNIRKGTETPTVTSAVIEIGGKVYEGKNHAEAILNAKADGQDISAVDRQAQGQFKLSDGTIIDRKQAKEQFGQDRSELIIPQDEASNQANIEYKKIQDEQANPVTPVEPINAGQKVDNGAGIQQPDVNGGEIQQGNGQNAGQQGVPQAETVGQEAEDVKVKNNLGGGLINNAKDTESIIPIAEIDNLRSQKQTDLATGNAVQMEKDLLRDGIKESLVITYYPNEGKAVLTDGHNRLDVAKDMGVENLPIRIVEKYTDAPLNAKDWTPHKKIQSQPTEPKLTKKQQKQNEIEANKKKIVELAKAHNNTSGRDTKRRTMLRTEIGAMAKGLKWSMSMRSNGNIEIIDDKGKQRRIVNKSDLTPEQKQERQQANKESKKWIEKMHSASFDDIKTRVLQYFATGGKINTADLHETGFVGKDGKVKNQKEWNRMFPMQSKKAPTIERMIEQLVGVQAEDKAYTEARNAIIEVISNESKASARSKVMDALREQELAEGVQLNEKDQADLDKWKAEQLQVEKQNAELVKDDIEKLQGIVEGIDGLDLSEKEIEELSDFLPNFRGTDGEVDWNKVDDHLKNDFVTISPALESKLNKIIEDAKLNNNDKGTGSEVPVEEIGNPQVPENGAGKRQAESEYETEKQRLTDEVQSAKDKLKEKQKELEKQNQVELFGDVPKANELFAQEKDISKENKDAILKPFNEAVSKAEKELADHISNKDNFLKKYDNQSEIQQEEDFPDLPSQKDKQGKFTTIPKEAFTKLIETLKKAFPNVKVELFGKGNMDEAQKVLDKYDTIDLKTPNGTIYGFKTPDGRVFINTDEINANTPIHEFGHIWQSVFPEGFKRGIELLKLSKQGQALIRQIQKNPAYKGKSLAEIQAEALVTAIGNKGEKIFNDNPSLLKRFQEWLSDFFKTVGDRINKALGDKLGNKLGFKKLSPDDKFSKFTKDVVGELLGGKVLNESVGKDVQSEVKSEESNTDTIEFQADLSKEEIGKAYDVAQKYLETTDFNFDTDQRDAFIAEINSNPALKAMFNKSQLEKIYEGLPLSLADKVKIKYKLLVYNLKADNRANKAGLKQQQKDMVADITTLIKGNLGGITGKQAEKLTNLATTAVEKNSMVRLGKIINHITNLANQRVYNRAKDLHQIIKSRSKRKGGAQSGRLTSILQEMATINPAEVSDINRYVELAERVKLASNPVLKPTDAETSLVYDEVQAFVKAEHEEINRNAVKDLAEGDNALTFFTVLDNKAKAKFGDNTTFDDLTEQQQREVVESITKDDIKKYNLTEDEQQMLEAFREQKKEQKRQDFITETYKKLGELKDLLAESAGVITQTPAEKQITDAILDAKLDDMSASEMARLLKLINNITQNNDYSGGTAFVSSQNAEKSLSKVKALSDKIKGFNSLTKSLSFFRNLQQIGVAMAKGKRLGAELMEAMGINDVVRGIAKTKTYAHDNLMDFKAQNFSNKVFDPLSQMRQTIYAAVMQTPIGADINEAAQVQRWRDIIQSNIDNLRLQDKKEFTEQADLLQKAFDQIIGDSQSMKDVAQNMTTIDKEGEMVVQFFIDKHAEQKPRFRENSLLYHNNEIDEYDNYTKLNVTSINSVDGGGKGADLMEHKGVKSLARKKSKSMIDRQKYETLDATKTLDFNFINKQFKALTDNEYDINTSAAIETAQILFKPNNEELRKLLGSDNRNLLKEKMQIILSASQFAKSDILDDVSNELAQTSRAIALGSVSQGLKQATVLVSTLANAGGIDFTMYTGTPEQKNNIDKLLKQSEIGARRAEGAGGIYDTTNITKKITDSQALKFLKALRRGKADLTSLSMYVLRNTDVAVADISWLTYYKKYLQDKGLSFDDQFEYKNPNKDAMAYAETMVQTTQGANTESGQAEVWEKWKNAAKIFMPFMSFSLQGKLRMIDNTQNLFSTKDARTEAVRDMIGFTIEQTSFNAIKALLGYYVVGGLADVISHTLGYEDDDELAKKRKKEQAIESFYNNAAKDVTYGSIPLVDEATQRGMNAIFKGSFGTNVDLIPIYTNEQANVFKTGTLGALSMQLENTKKAWDVINGNKTFGDYTLNQQATKYKYKNDKGEENTYTIVHSNGYANKDDFFKKKGANYNNGSVPDEVLLEFALNPRKFEVVEELTPEKTTTTDSNLALDVTPEQKAYAAFIFATNVASLIGLNETMITQMNNKVQKKIIRKTIKE